MSNLPWKYAIPAAVFSAVPFVYDHQSAPYSLGDLKLPFQSSQAPRINKHSKMLVDGWMPCGLEGETPCNRMNKITSVVDGNSGLRGVRHHRLYHKKTTGDDKNYIYIWDPDKKRTERIQKYHDYFKNISTNNFKI